jgi:hypothetical protein
MSKYTLNVTHTDNGWVGHAIENEQIVFTTEALSDPQSCSQALVNFVSSQPSNSTTSVPTTPSVEEGRPTVQPTTDQQQPVRKCCGRG